MPAKVKFRHSLVLFLLFLLAASGFSACADTTATNVASQPTATPAATPTQPKTAIPSANIPLATFPPIPTPDSTYYPSTYDVVPTAPRSALKAVWQPTYSNRFPTAPISQVAFSPDSRLVAVANEQGQVRLFEVATNRQVLTFGQSSKNLQALAYAHTKPVIATGDESGKIRLWSSVDGKVLKEITTGVVEAVVVNFSRNDAYILVLGRKKEYQRATLLQVFNSENGVLLNETEGAVDFRLRVATFSSKDNNLLFGISTYIPDGGLYKWNWPDKDSSSDDEPFAKGEIANPIFAIASSPDSHQIAVAQGFNPNEQPDQENNIIKILNIDTGKAGKFKVHTPGQGIIIWLAYSPDGRLLYSAGENGVVQVWDTKDSSEVYRTSQDMTGGLSSVALSGDGKFIAVGFKDGSFKVWKIDIKN